MPLPMPVEFEHPDPDTNEASNQPTNWFAEKWNNVPHEAKFVILGAVSIAGIVALNFVGVSTEGVQP